MNFSYIGLYKRLIFKVSSYQAMHCEKRTLQSPVIAFQYARFRIPYQGKKYLSFCSVSYCSAVATLPKFTISVGLIS